MHECVFGKNTSRSLKTTRDVINFIECANGNGNGVSANFNSGPDKKQVGGISLQSTREGMSLSTLNISLLLSKLPDCFHTKKLTSIHLQRHRCFDKH